MAQLTAQQALDRSAKWLATENGMKVAENGTISVDGTPPLTLSLTTEDERLVITHVRDERGSGTGRADVVMALVPDRGTMLHVTAAVTKTGVTFTFTHPVFFDGFSRQAVVTAVNELVSTVDLLGDGPMTETRVHEPVAIAAAAPDVVAEPDLDAETAETPTVDVNDDGWKPSHRVPAGGVRAWDEPDPATQPSSRLEPRVELQVAEQKGDWARVVGINGWTGWVDLRKLEDLSPKAPGSALEIAGFKLRPVPLIGVAGLVLAAFLPWIEAFGGASANSFEIAASFLWDLTASGSPYLGVLLLGIAAAGLIAAGIPKPNPALTRLVGAAAIAVATLFFVQIFRGVSDGGGSLSEALSLLGTAPWVALGSGVLVLASARS